MLPDDPSIHTVAQGEYLSLIARTYGLRPERIWNHPANLALRLKRKSPNILHPGDELTIPPKEAKEETAPTERRHRFIVKAATQKIRLVLKDRLGKPIRNTPYRIWISGRPDVSGSTDGGGLLETEIPVNVQQAKLYVYKMCWDLNVGALNPISKHSGVQQRLNNLGFDCGAPDGVVGPKTRSALTRFQRSAGLPPTGVPDEVTRRKLEEKHEGKVRALPLEEEPQQPSRKIAQTVEEQSEDDPLQQMDDSALENLEEPEF